MVAVSAATDQPAAHPLGLARCALRQGLRLVLSPGAVEARYTVDGFDLEAATHNALYRWQQACQDLDLPPLEMERLSVDRIRPPLDDTAVMARLRRSPWSRPGAAMAVHPSAPRVFDLLADKLQEGGRGVADPLLAAS